VDYSGRSVIRGGPKAFKLHEMRLPKKMALRAVQAVHAIRALIEGACPGTVKQSRNLVEKRTSEIWDFQWTRLSAEQPRSA